MIITNVLLFFWTLIIWFRTICFIFTLGKTLQEFVINKRKELEVIKYIVDVLKVDVTGNLQIHGVSRHDHKVYYNMFFFTDIYCYSLTRCHGY